MKSQHKLQAQEQQQTAEHKQNLEQTATEFASVEDMLRQDAQNTPVPPTVAQRLRDSVQRLPGKKSWWRRLVGGDSQ